MFYVTLCVICVLGAGGDPAALGGSERIREGPWRAWLDSPGGELPFGLELQRQGDTWKAWLINGSDRSEVPRVEIDGDEIVLSITHYDSTIRAKVRENGANLDGEWKKRGRNDKVVRLPFHAAAGNVQGCGLAMSANRTPDLFSGRWLMRFKGQAEPAVMVLKSIEGFDITINGTILTPTGDYGFLAGSAHQLSDRDATVRELRLSTFDGAHAFLLVGHLDDEDSAQGDFWSGDTIHDIWTAKRDDAAVLPDGFSQTSVVQGVRLADLKFPDLDGKTRSLADPAFAGKARIIEVFGSWCPNCNDASRYLVELHRKYKSQGLSIVGLAFEYTGDFQRDAEQVRAFAKYHEIEYPLLLAGVADREKASASLPIIDKLRAYPTIILLDAEGKGRAVYTGFSGPATGEEYTKFRAKFESLIEELLAQGTRAGG